MESHVHGIAWGGEQEYDLRNWSRTDNGQAVTNMNKQPHPIVRVMIVEDDHETRERFAHAITSDPRTRMVEKACTGREALELFQDARPDVLLVDLGLPDLHGTEVIRHAMRTRPECDVMVITVFGDERNVLASIEAGATGYVLKDSRDADLVTNILELRAGGAPMSPGIARMVLNRMHTRDRIERKAMTGVMAQAELTAREIEVLTTLSRGYTYAEIGERLGISLGTVTSHIKNSYRKLTVHSGAAAVTRAAELGLLQSFDEKPPTP
jgi:DNA-binding NarL/FixJ family response regulator